MDILVFINDLIRSSDDFPEKIGDVMEMSMLNIAYLPMIVRTLISPKQPGLSISSALYFLILTFQNYEGSHSRSFYNVLCHSLVGSNISANLHERIHTSAFPDILELFKHRKTKEYNLFKFNSSHDLNSYMLSNFNSAHNYDEFLQKLRDIDQNYNFEKLNEVLEK